MMLADVEGFLTPVEGVREAAAKDLDGVLGTFADSMPPECYHRLDAILTSLRSGVGQ
jgi:hypothetical protein